MKDNGMNELFAEGIASVQEAYSQLDQKYRDVCDENELLWNAVMELGNEQLLYKLWDGVGELLGEGSGRFFVFHHIMALLGKGRYHEAVAGLHYASAYADSCMPTDEHEHSLISDIMYGIMNVETEDVDDLERLLLGWIRFMVSAENTVLRNDIHDFLADAHEKLKTQIAGINSPDLILAYLGCLLLYKLKDFFEGYVKQIMEVEWPFLESQVEEGQREVFSLFNRLASGMTGELPAAIKDPPTATSVSNEMPPAANSAPAEPSDEPPKAKTILQVKNNTDHCPHCQGQPLGKKLFTVQAVAKGSKSPGNKVVYELMYCPRCERNYVFDNMKQELTRLLAPYRITIGLDPVSYPPKSRTIVPSKSKAVAASSSKSAQVAAMVAAASGRVITYSSLPSHAAAKPKPSGSTFAWPSTEVKASGNKSDMEGNFQDETRLHRLGYQITGLSRNHRWDILVRKALPAMSLQEIATTIARLVRNRKIQTNGSTKYAHAIAEWEHDLKRLKQEYYKSTFSWPKY